ncbi:MAG: hypothetical protein HYX63_12735 [Gammaproteobacteria bacterium]|nr:hypothetical protein [Gammaproteobacteria bacterium]
MSTRRGPRNRGVYARPRHWPVILGAALATTGLQVQANDEFFIDGDTLHAWCEAADVNAGRAQCLGYLESAVDTHETLVDWKGIPPKFCMPSNVTLDQIRLVVVKGMNEHPEELHSSASSLALRALNKAFPCP